MPIGPCTYALCTVHYTTVLSEPFLKCTQAKFSFTATITSDESTIFDNYEQGLNAYYFLTHYFLSFTLSRFNNNNLQESERFFDEKISRQVQF